MKLYKQKENKVENYEFKNDFRLFLKSFDILRDEEIIESDKIQAVWEILFCGGTNLPIDEKKRIVAQFFKLWGDKESERGEKCFDFSQDAELIYSAFWQSYNLDLFTAVLTIEQFLALFKGLPKGTKFADVVEIRTMPLPKPTKYNAEHRNSIIKAKNNVKLKSTHEDFANTNPFATLGAFIQNLAKKKKG